MRHIKRYIIEFFNRREPQPAPVFRELVDWAQYDVPTYIRERRMRQEQTYAPRQRKR